ncbi:MAG: hypothetical protein R3Y06_05875 [Faecalibacterium sp.]
MNCEIKVKSYQSYTWIYALGAVLTLVNGLLLQNKYISKICLFVLYLILFYKSVQILIHYNRTEKKQYQSIDKKQFANRYSPFRLRVLLFWLAFAALCVVAKFAMALEYHYFYSCTYFFLLLDRLFINVGCPLRFFSDPQKETVLCCCGCPCRGWDLLMIHTPLLFALHAQALVQNSVIMLSSALAAISFLCWENAKYRLVENRKKCPTSCNLSLCKENRP